MPEQNVKQIKLEKILAAAAREFAEKGYEKASTAQISLIAGVSKGLLFHHFETKKGLYLEVVKRITISYIAEIDKVSLDGSKTFLDSIVKISDAKMKYIIAHPHEYDILAGAAYSPPDGLRDDINAILNKYIDKEKYYSEEIFMRYEFRKDINPRKAWEVVEAVTNLIVRKVAGRLTKGDKIAKLSTDELKELSDELMEYLEIVFYGIAGYGGEASKGGRTHERGKQDNDRKGRYQAV